MDINEPKSRDLSSLQLFDKSQLLIVVFNIKYGCKIWLLTTIFHLQVRLMITPIIALLLNKQEIGDNVAELALAP